MNKINISIVFLALVFACKGQQSEQDSAEQSNTAIDYLAFGEKIDGNGAISDIELSEEYVAMAVADTIQTKFRATVTEVCKSKGCWMKLQLPKGQEAMVRFKDYGFFMPKDIEGREVIVNGAAFVEEMSIEDQKHYAKDGGQSEAEIAKITAPKKTYGFEADGVLLVQE